MQAFKINDPTSTNIEDFTQLIVDLLSFGQTLCKKTHGIGERLCHEVVRATQGKARLLLPFQDSSNGRRFPFSVSVSFPVQFRQRIYGRLEIAPDSAHPGSPAIPLPVAQVIAHTCGSLLYALELSAFVDGQCQRLDSQVSGHLTRREQEVLALICRGNDQRAIATMLSITPTTVDTYRKHICWKLGVHSERDIPLAAYQAGLFSVLDESPSISSISPAGRS